MSKIIELFERLVLAIEAIAGNVGFAPEPEKEQPDPDTEKEDLTKKLEAAGVKVEPRKRVETLRKMWAEVEAAGAGEEEEDLFGGDPAPTYTKAQVQAKLKAYIDAGADDTEKAKLKNDIRLKLNEFGAKNLSELAEEHYGVMVEAFTG